MDLLEIIKGRRSVRSFERRELPEEVVEALKEALIWAPSAGNLQARKFYFVFDRGVKEALVRAALNQRFIAGAPLAIVCCGNYAIERFYGRRGVELYMIQDVAASIENLMLLAHSLGLGSVWVGAFDEREVSRVLNLPDHLRPLAIVPVGYPAKIPSPPPRVSKEEAVVEIR